MKKPVPSTPEECAAVREQIAIRKRYADAGPEMERLLRVARLVCGPAVTTQIDAVLKAVQPKKEGR